MEIDYMAALQNGLGKTAFEGLHDAYFIRGMANQKASYSAALPPDDYASRMQRTSGQSGSGPRMGIGYALLGLGEGMIYSSSSEGSPLYSSERKTKTTHNLDSIADKECVRCGKKNDSPYPHCDDCLVKMSTTKR